MLIEIIKKKNALKNESLIEMIKKKNVLKNDILFARIQSFLLRLFYSVSPHQQCLNLIYPINVVYCIYVWWGWSGVTKVSCI